MALWCRSRLKSNGVHSLTCRSFTTTPGLWAHLIDALNIVDQRLKRVANRATAFLRFVLRSESQHLAGIMLVLLHDDRPTFADCGPAGHSSAGRADYFGFHTTLYTPCLLACQPLIEPLAENPTNCYVGGVEEQKPHLIGYARVSMADQDPQMQIDALVRAGVAPEDIYHEKVSGAAKRRRQFEAMLKDARGGDVIVIWKLDRLGRSTLQVLDTIKTLAERGVQVRCITQPFDTTTAFGKAMLAIAAAFAELERDLIRERTLAGLAAARERGRIGGATPKLSTQQIRTARRQIDQGRSGNDVAAEHGVTRSALYKAFSKIGLRKRIVQ